MKSCAAPRSRMSGANICRNPERGTVLLPPSGNLAHAHFLLSAGAFVSGLTDEAIAAGERIGTVTVDMGNTACKVPYAPDYLRKIQQRGTIGKKRKSARC